MIYAPVILDFIIVGHFGNDESNDGESKCKHNENEIRGGLNKGGHDGGVSTGTDVGTESACIVA